MEIFNLSDAPKYANQEVTGEERIEKIFEELDNAIKKAVTLTEFDITSSSMSIFANGTSILSTITDKEIDMYLRERDWKIKAIRSLSLEVKVPTYQYLINFGEKYIKSDVFIDLLDGTVVYCGTVNSLGVLSVNLAKELLSYGIHPHYLREFYFTTKLTDEKFTIEKIDTEYNFLKVDAKLVDKKELAEEAAEAAKQA